MKSKSFFFRSSVLLTLCYASLIAACATDGTPAQEPVSAAAPDGGSVEDANDSVDGNEPRTQDGGVVTVADAGRDSSRADGGSSGGVASTCVELNGCCDKLGSSMVSACRSIVQGNIGNSCSSFLQNYRQNGYCTGGTHCAELASCCTDLPATWRSSCTYYVDLNNDPECVRLLGTYKQDGYCGGGPPGACNSLRTCCQSLASGLKPGCDAIVTANSQTDCATYHANYKQRGLCN